MAKRATLAELTTDVRGDEERGIPGLIKEVDHLNGFRKTVENFILEWRSFFRGAKWVVGLNLVQIVLIILLALGVIGPRAQGLSAAEGAERVRTSGGDVASAAVDPAAPAEEMADEPEIVETLVPDWTSDLVVGILDGPLDLLSGLLFGE